MAYLICFALGCTTRFVTVARIQAVVNYFKKPAAPPAPPTV